MLFFSLFCRSSGFAAGGGCSTWLDRSILPGWVSLSCCGARCAVWDGSGKVLFLCFSFPSFTGRRALLLVGGALPGWIGRSFQGGCLSPAVVLVARWGTDLWLSCLFFLCLVVVDCFSFVCSFPLFGLEVLVPSFGWLWVLWLVFVVVSIVWFGVAHCCHLWCFECCFSDGPHSALIPESAC